MRFVLLLLVAGCATSSQPSATDAMRGVTRAAVLACAGAPQNEAVDGETRVMGYSRNRINDGTMYHCTASILLTAGQVESVTYSGARRICRQIISPCLK